METDSGVNACHSFGYPGSCGRSGTVHNRREKPYQCSFHLCQTDERQRFYAGTILGLCKIRPDDRGGTAFLQGVSVPSLLWGGIYSDR